MSVPHKKLLLLKNATVNWNLGFDDVCNEKYVIVAYNNEPWYFEVSNITGNMREYEPIPEVSYNNVGWEWEIQAGFFENNKVKPIWLNAYYNWGTLNYTTGQWSGTCGMIQRNEADYGVWGFSVTLERNKVLDFSPGQSYQPKYWLTRYPAELSPTWNLLGLFTKVFISLMSWFFNNVFPLECLDVDILFHFCCFWFIKNMFKIL